PLAGVADALADAGRLELALLPGEFTIADQQVNRVRVGTEDADDRVGEFTRDRAIEVVAGRREHHRLVGNAVGRPLGRWGEHLVGIDAFKDETALDAAAAPVVLVGLVAHLVEVHDAVERRRIERRAAAQVYLDARHLP